MGPITKDLRIADREKSIIQPSNSSAEIELKWGLNGGGPPFPRIILPLWRGILDIITPFILGNVFLSESSYIIAIITYVRISSKSSNNNSNFVSLFVPLQGSSNPIIRSSIKLISCRSIIIVLSTSLPILARFFINTPFS